MHYIPPEVMLTWPKPNYKNPQTHGPALWVITSIFLFISTITVGGRLYSRVFVRRWFGPDDWLIVIATIFNYSVTALIVVGNLSYGWDRHIWDLPYTLIPGALKTLYAARLLWVMTSAVIRLSVAMLYYRLLKLCRGERYRWILDVVTAIIILHPLSFGVAMVFSCVPIRAYWTYPPIPGSKCVNDAALVFTGAVVNTLQEFIVATLPVFAVYHLGVQARQRWHVICLLSLGYLVSVAGAFRSYYVWKVMTSVDLTWWATPHWICSQVELNTAIACACAPPLRPLIGRTLRRLDRTLNRFAFYRNRKLRNESRHSAINGKNSISTEIMTELSTSSYIKPDAETWNRAMECFVDLEGICNDGYGYTVSVTGPAGQEKKRRWFGMA